MEITDFREFCLSLPFTEETTPFGPDVLVYKVGGKMYALGSLHVFESITVKCEPDKAIKLRETYAEVQPGYHMNKAHWNTISVIGKIPNRIIAQWICDSYVLVLQRLPKKLKLPIFTAFDSWSHPFL